MAGGLGGALKVIIFLMRLSALKICFQPGRNLAMEK